MEPAGTWGFEAIAVQSDFKVTATKVNQIQEQGSVSGKGPFLIPNSSVKAVNLANTLLQQGVSVKRDSEGDFYTEAAANEISAAVKQSGLHIESAKVPADAVEVADLKVAILKDGGMNKAQSHSGTKLALKRLASPFLK